MLGKKSGEAMVKCSFCGREEHPSRGIHFIKNIGVVNYFCSSKCRKNSLKLRRDKRKLKWTSTFHEAREKSKMKTEDSKTEPETKKKKR